MPKSAPKEDQKLKVIEGKRAISAATPTPQTGGFLKTIGGKALAGAGGTLLLVLLVTVFVKLHQPKAQVPSASAASAPAASSSALNTAVGAGQPKPALRGQDQQAEGGEAAKPMSQPMEVHPQPYDKAAARPFEGKSSASLASQDPAAPSAAAPSAAAAGAAAPSAESPAASLDEVLSGIARMEPQFGPGMEDVKEAGADSTGKADSLPAFKKALERLKGLGGGVLHVPAGLYTLWGPLVLESKVVLEISQGATVKFSVGPSTLPLVQTWYEGNEVMSLSPLLSGRGLHDIGIRGNGTLDGGGHGWRHGGDDSERLRFMNYKKTPVAQRQFRSLKPMFIQFFECQRILIEGVTIQAPPMWTIHPVKSQGFIMRHTTVITHGTPNGDGIDPEMSSDVLIEDCTITTHDDGIALKAGRNYDGLLSNKPLERVVVRRVKILAESHGKQGKAGVAFGSEGAAGIRDVWIQDCELADRTTGINLKAPPNLAGVYENIHVQRVTMSNIKNAPIQIKLDYGGGVEQASKEHPPYVRNIFFEGIKVTKSKGTIHTSGRETHMKNVRISDSVFAGKAPEVRHEGWLTVSNTQFGGR